MPSTIPPPCLASVPSPPNMQPKRIRRTPKKSAGRGVQLPTGLRLSPARNTNPSVQGFLRQRTIGQCNLTDGRALSARWRTCYGIDRRAAATTRCINGPAWGSGLSEMSSPSDHPERVKIRFGYEYQTLRCTSCGLVYDAQVQTDPLKSDDRGLIESELVPPKVRSSCRPG